MSLKREIRITADGSSTLFIPEWDENYHSTHGAIQEAEHVFIEHGLKAVQAAKKLRILEVGFGTGLNALLTLRTAKENGLEIEYTGIEAFPVESELVEQLNYVSKIGNGHLAKEYELFHNSAWDTKIPITSFFTLEKLKTDFKTFIPSDAAYDLIYFDAFGPRAQEEMWNKLFFERLFAGLDEQGVLVTYCAKGQVKRDLKASGFLVEALPGPPGKREMTRAKK